MTTTTCPCCATPAKLMEDGQCWFCPACENFFDREATPAELTRLAHSLRQAINDEAHEWFAAQPDPAAQLVAARIFNHVPVSTEGNPCSSLPAEKVKKS